MKRKFVQKWINKQNKIKSTTTNVPEKHEINVKTRWTTNMSAKDKIYSPCTLLSRLKYRFDGKENSVIEMPKHFQISKASHPACDVVATSHLGHI